MFDKIISAMGVFVGKNYSKDSAMTAVVNMLEREGTFTEIVHDILVEAEKYLDAKTTSLMQINSSKTKISTIITHNMDGSSNNIISEVSLDSEASAFFSDKFEITEYSDSTEQRQMLLGKMEIGAVATSPIFINDMVVMYFAVFDVDEERHFDDEERQFITDVTKIIQSIAQKKVINSSLLSSYELLREILSNIGSGIIVCSRESGNVLFENEIAQNVDEVRRILKESMQNFFRVGCPMENPKPVECYDSMSGLWFEVKFAPLKWIDDSAVIICTSTDITQKKKNQQKIEFQANNDFLTGLYNRMKCEHDLRKLVKKTVAEQTKGAIMFIDLDNFKQINDGLGHQYGDVLLQQVAAGLQGIPGLRGHCYRMGGDEFLVILEPQIYDQLDEIVRRISEMFNRSWYVMGTEYYCTMSMGIAIFPDNDNDINELIKKADIAMYEAKKGGKNQYAFYSAGHDKDSIKQLDIENNMRQAIASECSEFLVYYQPVVDAATGDCVSCEALVRWNSGALGFMCPGEFIPMAEYLGLITSIGDYVLESACKQCKAWNDNGYPDFRININLSVVQLLQKDVIDIVKRTLEKTGVNPKNIVLEITESFAINDMERVLDIVDRLKELGPKIALDDFGTGYSSLSYIKQLPFDIIKIDKTFIDDLVEDDYSQAFVKLIVDLSKTLDSKVCVEGVETEDQYKLLADLGVDYIQGYFFGKPVPMIEFERRNLGKNLK